MPEPTAEHWQAVAGLCALNEAVRRAVAEFDPARLDEPLVTDPPYPAYTQVVGLTQHDLYHAGQIALLKRALAQRGPAVEPRAAADRPDSAGSDRIEARQGESGRPRLLEP